MGPTDRVRFWSYVTICGPDECWPWHGAKKGPYGQIKMNGRSRSAHAVAWELHHNEPMPPEMYGLHRCNNPICVNPAHIYPGTQSENIRTSVEIRTHRNSRKTHCERGHELTEENTYRRPSRPHARQCRICRHDYSNTYYAKDT